MKKKSAATQDDPNWRSLRDEQGRLYGRVDRAKLLLELRSHNGPHKTITFDLKTILEIGQEETKEVK